MRLSTFKNMLIENIGDAVITNIPGSKRQGYEYRTDYSNLSIIFSKLDSKLTDIIESAAVKNESHSKIDTKIPDVGDLLDITLRMNKAAESKGYFKYSTFVNLEITNDGLIVTNYCFAIRPRKFSGYSIKKKNLRYIVTGEVLKYYEALYPISSKVSIIVGTSAYIKITTEEFGNVFLELPFGTYRDYGKLFTLKERFNDYMSVFAFNKKSNLKLFKEFEDRQISIKSMSQKFFKSKPPVSEYKIIPSSIAMLSYYLMLTSTKNIDLELAITSVSNVSCLYGSNQDFEMIVAVTPAE